MEMEFVRRMPQPQELMRDYPLDAESKKGKAERDRQISDVLTGKDARFLLIVGPCSADARMRWGLHASSGGTRTQVRDRFVIVPRVYTNKPRTRGVGYKGMLHQPDVHKEEDLLAGIIAIRRMHIHVIQETGFSCADEMLYPSNFRYLSDLLSYVQVGDRSWKNQVHRLVSSGLAFRSE